MYKLKRFFTEVQGSIVTTSTPPTNIFELINYQVLAKLKTSHITAQSSDKLPILTKEPPMPVHQSKLTDLHKSFDDFNTDELKQTRDYIDNQLANKHPDYSSTKQASDLIADMSETELYVLREQIEERLLEDVDQAEETA